MWSIYPRPGELAAWLVLILPGISTLGCDRSPPLHPDVPAERRILRLVEDVDDFAQTPRNSR